MAEEKALQTNQQRALTVKEETVDRILQKIQVFQQRGELDLPANYSPGNALKSAWLMLQEVVDKDKKPALSVCTRESIANAMLDMVVQGLNPVKKQGYFIVYGTRLVFQRSYFGAMHVAKQVTKRPIKKIVAEVVYEGDGFEYEIRHGEKYVTKHVQKLGNVDGKKIAAAYCQVLYEDGDEPAVVMTMEQIKKSWAKSKMNPLGDGSTHSQFPEEMAKRTVTNRACKPIINDSTDAHLFGESYRRADQIRDEVEAQEEIEEKADQGEVIDIKAEPVQAEIEAPKPTNGGAKNAPPVAASGAGEAAAAGPGF
jgi:recombination protein RecT